MGLLSFYKRNREAADAPASVKGAPQTAQQARARVRQRLIGAVVLVVVAIIAFPLLFETQPRPVALDIPIEIPRPESVPPLAMPGDAPATLVESTASPQREAPAPNDDAVTEAPADAGRDAPAASPAQAAKPPEPATVRHSQRAGPETTAKRAVERPAPPPVAVTQPAPQADRAHALRDGKPGPAAKEKAKDNVQEAPEDRARFVVQVGAFADASAARAMRSRVERLGFKSYTQVVKTSAGNRVRVRVGPFASREEADKVSGRIKSAGLQSVVLTL